MVGGGIAGLAATTALAERGVRVVLLEREAWLGGRAGAWPTTLADGSAVSMSRGFHAFFRQYYTLRALLRRSDPDLSRLRPIDDYPLVAGDGSRDSFTGIARTPPFNLAHFVARSPSFTARELAGVNVGEALRLLKVEFPATFSEYDGVSAADFLDRLRFPAKARHLSLEVFARSFFADPRGFSAGELVGMFHTYFVGSAEGLLFDVPDDDYDTALWAPLARYLHGLGVQVRTEAAVLGSTADELVHVHLEDAEIECDAVIFATDLRSVQRLAGDATWLSGPDLHGWQQSLAARRSAPPFAVWRLWFDRPVATGTPAFLGTSGRGPLDNVSVLDRFEAGAAAWARATGGSVVELHGYALDPLPDPTRLRESLRDELFRLHPELAGARVIDERWLVADDCPLIGTDPWAQRPGVLTPDPRLVLAGDGIRCELPVALMERAAVTGVQAANALLAGAGLAGHDIWTVPMKGLLR